MRWITRLGREVRARRIRRWARARMRRNDAVIVDTETTDLGGQVIQVSVIDLHGTVLLSTLVKPSSPIAATATAVHGITDADVTDAPTMAAIAPQLHGVVDGKWLLAYNAPFDRNALLHSLESAGCATGRLASPRHWRCLMRLRASAEDGRWAKLGGPHHALGDCVAALQVLHRLADPSPATTRRRDADNFRMRAMAVLGPGREPFPRWLGMATQRVSSRPDPTTGRSHTME